MARSPESPLWQCPKCARRFANRNQSHACGRYDLESHFRGKPPEVVAFGVVADPAGAFGIAIIEVADEDEARRLTANDPTIRSGRGFSYEMLPMPRGAVHPPRSAV